MLYLTIIKTHTWYKYCIISKAKGSRKVNIKTFASISRVTLKIFNSRQRQSRRKVATQSYGSKVSPWNHDRRAAECLKKQKAPLAESFCLPKALYFCLILLNRGFLLERE